MNLDEILNKYEDLEKKANMNLDLVPVNVRPGFESSKRSAQQDIPVTKREYGAELNKRALCVFLEGDAKAQEVFSELAEDEANTITLDADRLYRNTALRLWKVMGERPGEWNVNLYMLMVNSLKVELKDLDIKTMGRPSFSGDKHVASLEELTNVVRESLKSAASDDVLKWYLEYLLREEALKVGYNGQTVGVVVVNATPDEIKILGPKLCSGVHYVAKVPDNVTKDSVLKTLVQAKKQLKK